MRGDMHGASLAFGGRLLRTLHLTDPPQAQVREALVIYHTTAPDPAGPAVARRGRRSGVFRSWGLLSCRQRPVAVEEDGRCW
jgi:hypothetical protein